MEKNFTSAPCNSRRAVKPANGGFARSYGKIRAKFCKAASNGFLILAAIQTPSLEPLRTNIKLTFSPLPQYGILFRKTIIYRSRTWTLFSP